MLTLLKQSYRVTNTSDQKQRQLLSWRRNDDDDDDDDDDDNNNDNNTEVIRDGIALTATE